MTVAGERMSTETTRPVPVAASLRSKCVPMKPLPPNTMDVLMSGHLQLAVIPLIGRHRPDASVLTANRQSDWGSRFTPYAAATPRRAVARARRAGYGRLYR